MKIIQNKYLFIGISTLEEYKMLDNKMQQNNTFVVVFPFFYFF